MNFLETTHRINTMIKSSTHSMLVIFHRFLDPSKNRGWMVVVCCWMLLATGCNQFGKKPGGLTNPPFASAPPVTTPDGPTPSGPTPSGIASNSKAITRPVGTTAANNPSVQPIATTVVADTNPVVPAWGIANGTPSQGNQVVQVAGSTDNASSKTHVAYQPPLDTTPGVGFEPYNPIVPVPGGDIINAPPPTPIMPPLRDADLIVNGYPARTGRIMFGGAVNSDAGVTGQVTIDERNFDITRFPTSFQDLVSGTAFRGAGQTLRIEAVPGSRFQRYTASFSDPNLLGYLPISMSVGGFLYDRRFSDWDEQRLGGRISFGYRVTPDLSIAAGVSGQSVEITNPRILGVPQLDAVLGQETELYSGQVSLTHDTRDSPIQAGSGHYFQFTFEEVFGDFDYARFETEFRQYWLLSQRADGSGRQTLSYSTQLGFSGDETPIFENFFAGGYATLRGFDFRGAGPRVGGVEVGGRFQWLNSVEYTFPITADDAFKGVAFVDFGTVEDDVKLDGDTFRVAPGVGLRVAIPLMGPAPLAFDFAFPVNKADFDDERLFSFYMSLIR